MMRKSIIYLFFSALLLLSCKKDVQIEAKTPKVTEEDMRVSYTEVAFDWKVEYPGKVCSMVRLGTKSDLSDAKRYGDDRLTSDKEFSVLVSDLQDGKEYYYCYDIWNPGMELSSDVKRFSTKLITTLLVTTLSPTEVTETSAVCGGNVTDSCGVAVTERGICWSTSHNPTTNHSHASSGSGTGSYTVNMTNLTPNTTYYVRAYAINSAGTAYGSEVSFTTLTAPTAPTGAINGLFSVSAAEQVYFSQGNLQYKASSNTWRFAENQWDYVGNDNSNISQTYSGWIDLFGWGTSGYNHGAVCYQPWSTSTNDSGDYYAYGQSTYNLFDQTGQADWGYNAISNGGNTINTWRTLTHSEWVYVFNTRYTASGIRYAKAKVNNVNGVILVPDDWSNSYYSLDSTNTSNASFNSNTISSTQWVVLEQHGAVFLPAAGYRYWTSVSSVSSGGYFWSSSYDDSSHAWLVSFHDSNLLTDDYNARFLGQSVRLVLSFQ